MMSLADQYGRLAARMSDYVNNPEGHEEGFMPYGRWNYYGAGEYSEAIDPNVPVGPIILTPKSDLTGVKSDAVFRPSHYARLWPEPITVINAWGLNFNRGNALKYIARAGHKNDEVEDLRKAIRYLEIELECIERRKKAAEPGAQPKNIWSETL